MHLGALTTQASPRRARQSAVAAVLQIGTCDVDSTPYRAFFRAPPYGDRTHNLPNRQAVARARTAKPGANAPARQSAANAAPGRTTGGGGRGGSIKPYDATHRRSAPPTPAAAQAARRHPPPTSPSTRGSASPKGEARRECAGKPKRSARRAREDYGWGWAGRC